MPSLLNGLVAKTEAARGLKETWNTELRTCRTGPLLLAEVKTPGAAL